jgi:hypothetical protein
MLTMLGVCSFASWMKMSYPMSSWSRLGAQFKYLYLTFDVFEIKI